MKFEDLTPDRFAPITRRDLLRIAGAVAITGWPVCRAEETPARPMIGFSLYNMKLLPIAEALQVCQETGYECVELAVMPDWPCDPAKLTEAHVLDLKQQLIHRGLKLASLMENLPLAVDGEAHQSNLNRLKRAMELSRRLVSDQTPLIETVLGGSPDKWPLL